MKKTYLLLLCLAAIFLNINSAKAIFLTVNNQPFSVGTGSGGYMYSNVPPATFSVTITGGPANSTISCKMTHPSGSNIISFYFSMPYTFSITTNSSGTGHMTFYPSIQYPISATGGPFNDYVQVQLTSDATVWAQWWVSGYTAPPIGLSNYIGVTSAPTPITGTSGGVYAAHFYDYTGSFIIPSSWAWSANLYYNGGTYALPGSITLANSVNSNYTISSSITLPDYEWVRDANNDIMGDVRVNASEPAANDYAGAMIGFTSVPNKAKVAVLESCPDFKLTYTAGGATSYKIYYSTVPGPPYNGTGITQGSSPISTGAVADYTLTGMIVGTTYYITVKGVNASGESVSYSDPIVYTPMNCSDDVTGCITASNLVTNGNFSSGNTGFTSGLSYSGTCTSSTYYVGTQLTSKCSSWSPINFYDHTTGTGNFLIVDGNPSAAANLWNQNVTVNANTSYTFSFWARSLYDNPYSLGFIVNGTTVSSAPTVTSGSWIKYSATWFSGSTYGSIPISIKQLAGGLYTDLGIDDIYFGHCEDAIHGCNNAINLASNGNFSSGNTGFTSALSYGSNCSSGYYFVGTQLTSKCSSWAPANFMDHTTGTGNFMIIDGNASAACNVWSQNVSVSYNKNYTFSFWARSIYSNPFSIEFLINGATISATPNIQMGSWTQYSITWFSGMTTGSIPIALRQQTGGAYRDFGIDDIYFGYCDPVHRLANPETTATSTILQIYPNPNNGSFAVQTGSEEAKDIYVYDMMGKLVFVQLQVRETTPTIDITDQPVGLYLVKVVEGDAVQTQRVIRR